MILADLPTDIEGPSAWVAADLEQNEGAWLHRFSASEIAELETAADHF